VDPFEGLSAKDRVLLQKQLRKQQEEEIRKAELQRARGEYYHQKVAADEKTRAEYQGSNVPLGGPALKPSHSSPPQAPAPNNRAADLRPAASKNYVLEDDDAKANSGDEKYYGADELDDEVAEEDDLEVDMSDSRRIDDLKAELAQRTLRIDELRRSLKEIAVEGGSAVGGELEDDGVEEDSEEDLRFAEHIGFEDDNDILDEEEADFEVQDECFSPPSDDDEPAGAPSAPGSFAAKGSAGEGLRSPNRRAGAPSGGSLQERRRVIREQCVRALGLPVFQKSYEIVQGGHSQGLDEAGVRKQLESVMGIEKLHYWPLVDQLVFIESLI
jgi:hypothetical protein